MADPTPRIYLKTLNAYTLGYPRPEFYEAFLVTDLDEAELSNIIQNLRSLCREFPKIDKYVIRVFSDSKIADPKFFNPMLGLNNTSFSKSQRNSYVAEINAKGELILFPYVEEKRKIIRVGNDWCKG